jgi:hypothetical protein
MHEKTARQTEQIPGGQQAKSLLFSVADYIRLKDVLVLAI